jgi:hypothetical protein
VKRPEAPLRNLLIGDNSFIGVSHLSQERARERIERLDVRSIIQVIETALSSGATGYTFSTHPLNLHILEALRESRFDALDLYPVLPYAQGYVRLANERGMRGLIDEFLSRLSLSEKLRATLQGGLSMLRSDLIGVIKAYLDVELAGYLNVKPKNARLRSVLLHEVVTDLCLGLQHINLLDAFASHIREKYQANPGFVTYNLVSLVNLFRKSSLALDDVVIMTPFNGIGYQMSSTVKSCEACLSTLNGTEVIAMSIMAGGYLNLDQALDYIKTLPTLSGVALGVSSKQHAQEGFTKLGRLPSKRP